jgi:hypothetical protein
MEFEPGQGQTKRDWEMIRQEFFNSEFLDVAPFIRQKFGKETNNDGNMANQTKGWAEEKRLWKRKINEEIESKAKKELVDKLKIAWEDLLLNKKLLFSLDSKFLEIMGRLIRPDLNRPLTDEEKDFFNQYNESISEIYKRIQIELGLPINIQKMGFNSGDDIDKIKIEIVKSKEENGTKIEVNGNSGEEPTGIPEQGT